MSPKPQQISEIVAEAYSVRSAFANAIVGRSYYSLISVKPFNNSSSLGLTV